MFSSQRGRAGASGNGDREAIVVGAGLCDGEGERAYNEYAPRKKGKVLKILRLTKGKISFYFH